jgi:hypothetical protein
MWTNTLYLQTVDQAAWTTLAAELGDLSADNATICVTPELQPAAPWATPPVFAPDGSVATPGVPESGYWIMARLNADWDGYNAALAAIAAAGVQRTLADPPWVFA